MSAAKKQTASASPAWLGNLFSWLLGAGRPVLILLVLIGAFSGGTYLAWRKLKTRILGAPEYRVGPEQVELTPPLPDWIHCDIRAEVFCDPSLDGTLLLVDDDLTERISKAFRQHPWVASVGPVTKQYPASSGPTSVKVPLVYRKPACMVEVPGGLVAVDAEGVLLPSEENFTPQEATHYPRVVGVDRKPSLPAGRRWGDARVVGGAEIAAALGTAWEPMRLDRIETLPVDPAQNAAGDSGRRAMEPIFVLFTRGKTQIYWGYAPGANMLGEISAAEKVARLQQYLADHDTLDGPQGQLDVRKLREAKVQQ
jgi:hypothetical protein